MGLGASPRGKNRRDTLHAPVLIDGRYLTDHYPGIGRYVYNLVNALPDVAPEQPFTLLTDRTGQQTRCDLRVLERRGISIVPTGANPRSLLGQIGIRRLRRRLSASMFHDTHVLSPFRPSRPSLLTVHDVIPLHEPSDLPSPRHLAIYRCLLRRALASATHIVTLSEATRDDLAASCGVSPARITVTPMAADPSFRPATRHEIASLRTRMQLPERYVLYVGTNRPHKNLPRLLEAWARVGAGRRDGCQLVIAGPEDRRYPQARRQAAALSLDTVRFAGAVAEADLPSLYSAARLCVQPSLWEGFGLTVVEAMACGTPVACARVPALVEISRDAALHFDPTSPADMAAAIRRGLDEEALRPNLVSRGLARAGELSWTKTARLTLDAYRHTRHGTETQGLAL